MNLIFKNFSYKIKIIISILFIISIILFVYRDSFYADFSSYDDKRQILSNDWIREPTPENIKKIFTHSVWSFSSELNIQDVYYRPLLHIMYMFEFYFFGENSIGYNAINILIHVLNSILIFLIFVFFLKRINFSKNENEIILISFLTSILFAIHPINTEAVNWLACVTELTLFLFWFLGFFFHLIYLDKQKTYLLILSAISIFFALLSKEIAVFFIVFIFLYDILVEKLYKSQKIFKKVIPWIVDNYIYIIAYFIYFVARIFFNIGTSNYNLKDTILFILTSVIAFPHLLFKYITHLILPINLSMGYSYAIKENTFLVALFFVISLIILGIIIYTQTWRKILKNKILMFCFLLFFCPLMISFNIGLTEKLLLSDRYLYISSASFSLFFVYIMHYLYKKTNKTLIKQIIILISTFIFFTFSLLTMQRNSLWNNSETLFKDAFIKTQSKLSLDILTEEYCSSGKISECKKYSYISSQKKYPQKKPPKTYEYNYDMCVLYIKINKTQKAIEYCDYAYKLSENNKKKADVLKLKLLISFLDSNYEQALTYEEKIKKLDKIDSFTNELLMAVYCKKNDFEKAKSYFNKLPQYIKYDYNNEFNKNTCNKKFSH